MDGSRKSTHATWCHCSPSYVSPAAPALAAFIFSAKAAPLSSSLVITLRVDGSTLKVEFWAGYPGVMMPMPRTVEKGGSDDLVEWNRMHSMTRVRMCRQMQCMRQQIFSYCAVCVTRVRKPCHVRWWMGSIIYVFWRGPK